MNQIFENEVWLWIFAKLLKMRPFDIK